MATTGLSEAQKEQVASAAHQIPLVWAPSMSLAVNLTMKLATIAAEALRDCPGGADVEIIERHHRFKKDAPSGTALRFGQLIADAMGLSRQVHGREGQVGQRPHDELGYHAVRVGDNPGEHTIVFGMLGESMELTVRATNRDCYAVGALQAAKFVVSQPPGDLHHGRCPGAVGSSSRPRGPCAGAARERRAPRRFRPTPPARS